MTDIVWSYVWNNYHLHVMKDSNGCFWPEVDSPVRDIRITGKTPFSSENLARKRCFGMMVEIIGSQAAKEMMWPCDETTDEDPRAKWANDRMNKYDMTECAVGTCSNCHHLSFWDSSAHMNRVQCFECGMACTHHFKKFEISSVDDS